MQISVYIQGAHRNKALSDDPNESFAVFYYWLLIKYRWRQAVCGTDFSPNQLLPENINDLFLLCWGDFRSRARRRIHWCAFLNINRCKYGTQNECLHILFFYNPNKFFCIFWNLFNCKRNSFKVKINYKHWLCGDFRTRGQTFTLMLNFVCKLVF